MHNKNTCNKPLSASAIFRFLAVVFVLGAATQIAAVRAGMKNAGGAWLLLTMWMPTVAAVTTSRAAREKVWASIRRLSLPWLGIGLLVGLLPGLIKACLLGLSRAGHWDSFHYELAADGRSIGAIHHLAFLLGPGHQSFSYFAINLVLSLTLGSAMLGLIGGLGEELGWRVVLQPSFEQRFGRFPGTCLVGLIWAYWHLPVNLSGYNDAAHPLWNALLFFPLGVIAMSFYLAWLARESKSVWPAALAHGANNTIGSAFLIVANGWAADTIVELLSLWLVGGFFAWRSLRRNGVED